MHTHAPDWVLQSKKRPSCNVHVTAKPDSPSSPDPVPPLTGVLCCYREWLDQIRRCLMRSCVFGLKHIASVCGFNLNQMCHYPEPESPGMEKTEILPLLKFTEQTEILKT